MKQNESWPPVQHDAATPRQTCQASQWGWIGIGMALLGFVLPFLLFVLCLNYLKRVLYNPEMDDWETGAGLTELQLCRTVIMGLELVAFVLGMRAYRTVSGKITLFVSAVFLYVAYSLLGEWYMVATHF